MTASRFKDGKIPSKVGTRDKTRSTNESSSNVTDNISVQVAANNHVELLGLCNHLHGRVVYNHALELDPMRLVLLSNVGAGIKKKSIAQFPAHRETKESGDQSPAGRIAASQRSSNLHDVCLVNASDLFAAILDGEIKSKTGNPLSSLLCDDFQAFHHPRNRRVLQSRVLSLCVFTDNGKINVLLTAVDVGKVFNDGDGSVDVEVLAHQHIE